MKIQQLLFKLIRKQNVTDGRTHGRTVDGRTEPNSFMHMFNVSTLYRQSIKLFYQKLWLELVGPCMD